MHNFDYSFLDNGLLPAGLLNITADIYSLRVMDSNRREQYKDVFTQLAEIAKVQSVKSSNEIEGIVTTDIRINEIVNGNSAPLNHNEQEIVGYRDALAEVHKGYSYMDLCESDILRLHTIMMNIAGYSYAGKYKDVDNDIIEEDKYGRRRVRFHPTSAADTPDEMEQLILVKLHIYFRLVLRSYLVSAERIELTFSVSETDVLPLDEAESSIPSRYRREYLIDYNDLVNSYIKQMRQYDHIVNGWHGISSHPFEYCLRSIESAYILYISYL